MVTRYDRSNICPMNLPCKVLGISKHGTPQLQCQAGIIKDLIHEDSVVPWTRDINLDNLSQNIISVIAACRSITSYSKESAKCKNNESINHTAIFKSICKC